MVISEEIRKKFYERVGGRCECKSQRCDLHKGRCHQKLSGNGMHIIKQMAALTLLETYLPCAHAAIKTRVVRLFPGTYQKFP